MVVGVEAPGAAGETVHPGIRHTSPRLAVLKLLQLKLGVSEQHKLIE